jgi:dUTP pyrophosphatase
MKLKMIIFDVDALIPDRAHYNDAGADVFTPITVRIEPHETIKIPLGFGLEIPDGYMACIYPKSGLSNKGIISNIPPIDSGYRGEINAIITNTSDKPFVFLKKDKVGQIVVTPVILPEFVLELENTRGIGGFGSTGR